jgi:16S rRNA processing protein RimM
VPTSPKLPEPETGPVGVSGSAPGGAVATVVLGRVLGAFGIRGRIRIRPFTESAEGLLGQSVWVLRQAGANRVVHVEEARSHGAFVLAQIKGLGDRGQAEALRGADVMIGRDQLPAPAAGEYYWSDLIGLSVRNLNGVDLGQVTGLIAAPAHDVLRVASGPGLDQGRERLIPFVEPILREVDLTGRCVTVDWEADY